jgi:hypothetical protein
MSRKKVVLALMNDIDWASHQKDVNLHRNQTNLLPHKAYFNPFSQNSDSFVEDFTEYDDEESKSKQIEEIKEREDTLSYFGRENPAKSSKTHSSKLQGDSGSTNHIETENKNSEDKRSKNSKGITKCLIFI